MSARGSPNESLKTAYNRKYCMLGSCRDDRQNQAFTLGQTFGAPELHWFIMSPSRCSLPASKHETSYLHKERSNDRKEHYFAGNDSLDWDACCTWRGCRHVDFKAPKQGRYESG